MLQTDNDIGTIKHEVLFEVAKLAFQKELAEKEDILPFEMIPGPQANFRCCVYKEREIIRQRIRLAQGKSPSLSHDNSNIVQVISSACEECPITRFLVTDNCQKCMGKRCQKACNFQAISMSHDRAHIDPAKCKECGKCASACPYNAIADLKRPCKKSCPVDAISMDENNIVVIDEEKCINCGQCINNCPFGAISDRSFMVDVINLLNTDKPVYAMVAPAIEGQFGATASTGVMTEALKQLGFTGIYEVALGADLVAASEAEEWAEAYKEGMKKTTSCCPAFVKMIKKHYPSLVEHISSTISPMQATAKYIKAIHEDAITVFVGPCIAKKGEVLDHIAEGGTDYALTFDELYAMLRAKDISLEAISDNIQHGSIFAKNFAVAGGVTASVVEALKEKGIDAPITVAGCNGAAECKKALTLLKVGKFPGDFMEGMCCEGGCINGPGSILTGRFAAQNRAKLLSTADDRKIYDTVDSCQDLNIQMHRH
ncbi:MAG TPA: ferredoxin [Lachnoclostridium phytofermentans]|uniref:Ferredoxin n=1 Tax=Lachnoclostridium phytofermentans TaxID=66219 RepID=A0A3D2X352_9FIRM|nr:4Fe-4S dicluster domain-containing protein [Lachnoclostridium sp.]HCL01579.1 ferredoxin [Lachnoclostridium phytofermentans]